MNYAVNCGALKINPLLKIKTAFTGKKNKSLAALPVERLPEFLSWWDSVPHKYQIAHNALLFQILTMVRPGRRLKQSGPRLILILACGLSPRIK